MKDYIPFRTIDDGRFQIHLHPGQERVMDSPARFVINLAGSQGGKTCLGPVWTHREIQDLGGGDYLATTSTYDLFKLKMLPELLNEFVGGVTSIGEKYTVDIGRYWPGLRVIELAEDLVPGAFSAKSQDDPMWGRIILRSADARAGLESATAKAAWLDELGQKEFPREAWEATLRRVSISQGRILGTTSLYYWGWLKTELYDRWKDGDSDIEVIQFDSVTNPAFPVEEYKRAERTMPRWKFNLFYRGIYERPAGLIYDSFDDVGCKSPRIPVQKEWLVYVGHDFGPVNMAALFYAIDLTTGLIWLFHSYKSSGTVFHHVEEFKKITQGMKVVKRIGGAAGKSNEEGWREAFAAHGWPIQAPAENLKSPQIRIQRVYALHSLNKIMIMEDELDYLDEKMSFSYKLSDDYKPLENEIDQESKFHYMSAEQYILSSIPQETVVGVGIRTSRIGDRYG